MDFQVKKKYVDLQGNNKIYKTDKKFKLVGIIDKPEGFYVFNIFNITLNETIEEMGMLRLIGSTKRSVRRMVFYQGIIIMTFGIILGLIFGV